MIQKEKVRTNLKQRSITIKGVSLWNDLKIAMKLCKTLHMFKAIFKNIGELVNMKQNHQHK